mgnify:CR=1 FL=1
MKPVTQHIKSAFYGQIAFRCKEWDEYVAAIRKLVSHVKPDLAPKRSTMHSDGNGIAERVYAALVARHSAISQELAADTGLSKRQVNTALQRLRRDGKARTAGTFQVRKSVATVWEKR